MEDKSIITSALLKAEKKARQTKLYRLFNNPIRYPLLLAFQYLIYPVLKKGFYIKAKTFFGTPIKVLLPSGTDILLNKIKSHDSEIRLSKFLSLQLRPGDTFIDIGSHYGYYTLLASKMVGIAGSVLSIEPSLQSYQLLSQNTAPFKNIKTFNVAASNQDKELVFYEYSGPYSEYNTLVKDAYVDENWAKRIKPVISKISTVIIDELITKQNIEHAVIKIDVEGGEPEVLKGMNATLVSKNLTIVMEYLFSKTLHNPHAIAADILHKHGYHSFAIQNDGTLISIQHIEVHMKNNNLESDNIVFRKS